VSLLSLLTIGPEPTSGSQPRVGPAPVSLFDPRLGPLRAASARWEARQGPDRAVVDQVCLVPDLATFFEAVARWDRSQYFPILIEDAESTLRFLRAFQPARVVRLPKAAGPIPPERTWSTALASVKASWREPETAPPPDPSHANPSPRDACPNDSLGPTPPGVVLSNPDSPMLAAAAALAAGRFQPLVRLDSAKRYSQTLTFDEFRKFDRDLTAAVSKVAPDHAGLGDDCDFLTVAGNYPYRYRDAKGEDEAVDDGLGRSTETGGRWAYAGRILGDPASSVYRAMCSLFLQPESIVMFNGYDEGGPPWTDYSTRGASLRMAGVMASSHHAGRRGGGVEGWHEAFDPENRSGLVWINSHGSPTVFHLQNDEASTTDIPRTVPCAVVMIHSFSASDPNDPSTIAGRWLSNGAFVYFGSMNEPFLQSFRTPNLAIDLITEHLPLAAALRNTSIEPYSAPWRLEYLGDPLYRLKPRRPGILRRPVGETDSPRSTGGDWLVIAEPGLASNPQPSPTDESPEAALRSSFDEAVALAGSPQIAPTDPALAATIAHLSALNRDQLSPGLRRVYDSTLADLLFHARRRGELRAWIESIPPGDRSPELARWLDAARGVDFAWLLAGDDFDRMMTAWSRIIGTDAPVDFQKQATSRVGTKANDPERRLEWAKTLREAIGNRPLRADLPSLRAELTRVEAAIRLDQKSLGSTNLKR